MSGMYPGNQTIEIFGEPVIWPGVDANGKFTNGSFVDPMVKPSFIPADTINLILDNIENLIRATGFDPNNTDPDQLLKAMQRGFAPRIVGKYIFLGWKPPVEELIRLRILPVKGQIIEIAKYQELCDKIWVGPYLNDTFIWRYKCDEDGTRNIDGLFFQLEDFSGLFPRVEGVNSIVRTNMNDPLSPLYDSGNIGAFKADSTRKQTGWFDSRQTTLATQRASAISLTDEIIFKRVLGAGESNAISLSAIFEVQETPPRITMEIGNGVETAGAAIVVGAYIVY